MSERGNELCRGLIETEECRWRRWRIVINQEYAEVDVYFIDEVVFFTGSVYMIV